MCQSPGECEHVQLAQTFGQDLQAQLDVEREKTTRQFFRISELQETVKLVTETNCALRAALSKTSALLNESLAVIDRAQKGTV